MNPARDYKELTTLLDEIFQIGNRYTDVGRLIIKAMSEDSPCGKHASPEEFSVISDHMEWGIEQSRVIFNKFKGLSRASTKELLEGEL